LRVSQGPSWCPTENRLSSQDLFPVPAFFRILFPDSPGPSFVKSNIAQSSLFPSCCLSFCSLSPLFFPSLCMSPAWEIASASLYRLPAGNRFALLDVETVFPPGEPCLPLHLVPPHENRRAITLSFFQLVYSRFNLLLYRSSTSPEGGTLLRYPGLVLYLGYF